MGRIDFPLIVIKDDGFVAVIIAVIAAVQHYRGVLRVAEVLVQFILECFFDKTLFQLFKQLSLVKDGLWSTVFSNELHDQLTLASGIFSFFWS